MGNGWAKRRFTTEPWFFPPVAGCYVIYLDGKIGYIGCSLNLRERIRVHRIRWSYGSDIITPWGHFSRLHVKYKVTQKYGDWAMLELRLIRRLQPRYNKLGRGRLAK